MALLKTFDANNGYTFSYHNILAFTPNFQDGGVTVVVQSWQDADFRQQYGKAPALTRQFTFQPGGPLNVYQEQFTRADVYAALKTLPEFQGAEDA